MVVVREGDAADDEFLSYIDWPEVPPLPVGPAGLLAAGSDAHPPPSP